MVIAGLTGNIGSGKSTVSRVFSLLGIPVYNADVEAKKLYELSSIQTDLIEMFGPGIFDGMFRLNRGLLAEIIFNDPAAMKRLTDFIHPLVRQDFIRWLKLQSGIPYAIHEAAIIFESGFTDEFDRIIHVSCPPELAIERVMKRDGNSREAVEKRMQFQWSDHQKATHADYVILNDEKHMIIPQIVELDQKLKKLSR